MKNNQYNLITLKDCLPRFNESWKEIARSFEWYYFDLANSQYDIVLLFAIKDPLSHREKPSMWIEINDKNKNIKKQYVLICESFSEEHSSSDNSSIVYLKLLFDKNQIMFRADYEGKINDIEIVLNNKLLSGMVNITPKSQGFMYDDGYYVFDKNEKKISGAIFTVPFYEAKYDMAIEGEFKKIIHSEIGTTGYTDHPFGIECLSLTHKDWFWGHFQNDQYCIQYSIVNVFNGFNSKLNYVYVNDLKKGNINIYKNAIYIAYPRHFTKTNMKTINYPKKYKIICNENFNLSITNLEPIFEIAVYNRSNAQCSFNDKIIYGWTEYVFIKQIMKKIFYYLYHKLHQKVMLK